MIRTLLFLVSFVFSYNVTLVAHADADPTLMPYQLYSGDIANAVAETLAEEGVGEKIEVNLYGRDNNMLHSSVTPFTVRINTLNLDKSRNRFSANLLIMQEEHVAKALPIQGKYEPMVALPVVKERVQKGQIITEDMIEEYYFRSSRLRPDAVRNKQELIDKAAKGTISDYRPIREHEVGEAFVLEKNDLVELIYKSGPIEIKTSGQAVNSGAVGDVIAVKNVNSRSVVRGVVKSSHVVEIIPHTLLSDATTSPIRR